MRLAQAVAALLLTAAGAAEPVPIAVVVPARGEPVSYAREVADILDARHDGRDPAFVAVQVHTWIHGMVSLLGCAPDGPWPSTEALLDDLMVRLGLDPPTA